MVQSMARRILIGALVVSEATGFILGRPPIAARQTSLCGARTLRSGSSPLRMVDSFEEVPPELDGKVLSVMDPVSQKTLDCYAERVAKIGKEKFLVCYPKDDAVAIAMSEEGDISPISVDDPLMDVIFPIIEEHLKGGDLTLMRTPVMLTLRGLDDIEEGDADAFDDEEAGGVEGVAGEGVNGEYDEEEEGDDEEDEGEYDGDEDVELITEFDVNDETFLLVRYLEPLLMVVRSNDGFYSLIEDEEEDERLMTVVEGLLQAEDEA